MQVNTFTPFQFNTNSELFRKCISSQKELDHQKHVLQEIKRCKNQYLSISIMEIQAEVRAARQRQNLRLAKMKERIAKLQIGVTILKGYRTAQRSKAFDVLYRIDAQCKQHAWTESVLSSSRVQENTK